MHDRTVSTKHVSRARELHKLLDAVAVVDSESETESVRYEVLESYFQTPEVPAHGLDFSELIAEETTPEGRHLVETGRITKTL